MFDNLKPFSESDTKVLSGKQRANLAILFFSHIHIQSKSSSSPVWFVCYRHSLRIKLLHEFTLQKSLQERVCAYRLLDTRTSSEHC